MTRIVTAAYRYKRQPRKKPVAPLASTAVIIAAKCIRRLVWEKTAASVLEGVRCVGGAIRLAVDLRL